MNNPIQPILIDKNGEFRFKENAIVRYLIDNSGIDLNRLAVIEFSNQDRQQFAQLIGYSLLGYSELSYVSGYAYEVAAKIAEDGLSETEARISYLEQTLAELRISLREPVAKLFGIHPDDLDKEQD